MFRVHHHFNYELLLFYHFFLFVWIFPYMDELWIVIWKQ